MDVVKIVVKVIQQSRRASMDFLRNTYFTQLLHLQCGQDYLVHRWKVGLPQHLGPLSEGQDPVIPHCPHSGWHLRTNTHWNKIRLRQVWSHWGLLNQAGEGCLHVFDVFRPLLADIKPQQLTGDVIYVHVARKELTLRSSCTSWCRHF